MKKYLFNNHIVLFMVLVMLTLHFEPAAVFGDTIRKNKEIHAKSAWDLSWPRNLNPVHMVVVFTKFEGEVPGVDTAPSWAEDLFDGSEGSIPHFFDSISFGQYKVTGEYLQKMYEVPHCEDYFEYSLAVVKMLDDDPAIDFSRFDNEGRDGKPNSGDDDGYVDYMVFMPRTRPYDFILQRATGVMHLGLKKAYITNDRDVQGERILVDRCSGCVSTASNKNMATGTIIAELSHAYGATDLMDKVYVDPANDSAGIGYWGFLGRGALGWNERNGPVGPCAYNRFLMNSIGPYNSNLVDIYGIHKGLRMKDVGHPDGITYRLWVDQSEYFLLEFRNNTGSCYYDRNIPESGMLIWHIDRINSNSTELYKLCDLECADGRFIDKGYPAGIIPDPVKGGDNLDFWAHTSSHTLKYNGNQGDATDVYDGVNFTVFGSKTNPNSFSNHNDKPTDIEIFNIRREGDEMVFDCYVPPIPDRFPEPAPQLGLAFQRSTGDSEFDFFLDMGKELYLVNFGLGYRDDVLITVNKDSMLVEPLSFKTPDDAQKAIEKRLLTNEQALRSSQIVRRLVSIEHFTDIINTYGISPESIFDNKPVDRIYKIVRLSDNEIQHISAIQLNQNYPNPFNNQTTITYSLPYGGPTMLEVYNILGQRVMLINRGYEVSGQHSVRFDASHLTSGMYLYRLRGKEKLFHKHVDLL